MQTSRETKIQPSQNHVAQFQGVITAMESSDFWQMRNDWFRLKQNIGMGKDNFDEIRLLSGLPPEPLPSEPAPIELATSSSIEPISAPIVKARALKSRLLISLTRENIANLYLQGQGIEIGALYHPLTIPKDVKVLYVDRTSVTDLRKQYPELNDFPIVKADILANGEDLKTIADNTQDFVIANHFIEHCQDTIGTIQNMLRVLKPGGVLYSAIPDRRGSFHIDRDVTSLEHVWRDHNEGPMVKTRTF